MGKPPPALILMEAALGYSIDSTVDPKHRLYSDLSPVPDHLYGRTCAEYYELMKLRRSESRRLRAGMAPSMVHTPNGAPIPNKPCVWPEEPKMISGDEYTVTISASRVTGLYKYFVDIQLYSGPQVSLLFTTFEADAILSTTLALQQAKISKNTKIKDPLQSSMPRSGRVPATMQNLPPEVRNSIYSSVFQGAAQFFTGRESHIARTIGDPSGYYFPFDGDDFSLLQTNRKIREEALPFAYSATEFFLSNIEGLIKFLISIGSLGRANVEILQFSWENALYLDCYYCKFSYFPGCETFHPILPQRHVLPCTDLMHRCRRLRNLRLQFDTLTMQNLPLDDFKSDPGLLSLCTVRGIKKVEILDSMRDSAEDYGVAQWLISEMQS